MSDYLSLCAVAFYASADSTRRTAEAASDETGRPPPGGPAA